LIYDNPVLIARDPGYLKRLEALPEAKKQALLFGNWDIFEGQFFEEWLKRDYVNQIIDILMNATKIFLSDQI